jgi:hypothetical protein
MRNCFDSRACHWTEPVGGLRSVGGGGGQDLTPPPPPPRPYKGVPRR